MTHKTYFCPYNTSCQLFKNAGNIPLDIIIYDGGKYFCGAVDEFKAGSDMDRKNLQGRIPRPTVFECSHIELLNLTRREK